MKLLNLLEELEYTVLQGTTDVEITALINDSRQVTAGSLFVCILGAKSDGHSYAEDVVRDGAVVLVVERPVEVPEHVTVLLVKDTRAALAILSAAYFLHPARKLKTIGITGTKGKTTTTYMVREILQKAGLKVGLIGTIEAIIGDKVIPANNTTPESYTVQKYFSEMVEAGCDCAVMEVSSQGLMLHRVDGFTFDIGIFTNLEPDHIGPNEHKDFEDYTRCKGLLFQQCVKGIVNIDDAHVQEVLKDHTCEVETFGFSEKADLRAEHVELLKKPGVLGTKYEVTGLMNFLVETCIPGKFSVYNSLTAIAVCRHFSVPVDKIQEGLMEVSVRGRVELVPVSDRYTVMIDYAHNAMSLQSLLTTLKEYQPKRLVCLFGCGGNRAKSRRYEMGEISSRLADLTVVTSDNPREEDPEAIIADILVGVKREKGEYITVTDRREAVHYCIEHAEDGDVIILAGKGHEDYQEIKGVKYKMDDRDIIKDIIAEQ